MAYLGDTWEGACGFEGAETEINVSIDETRSTNSSYNRYVYLGYGVYNDSSVSYIGTDKLDMNSGSRDVVIPWIEGSGNNLSISITTISPSAPLLPYKQFTVVDADFSDTVVSIPDGQRCSFFISFSNTSYSNDASTLFSPNSDVLIFIFTLTVSNPPKLTQRFPIVFLDGSSQITSVTYIYNKSRSPVDTCPEPVTLEQCQNANQLGVRKAGYRAIGWDTSPSATQVVYGGKTGAFFTIPRDTLRINTNYNLYSVWEKALNLQVMVNGELKTVSRGVVVVSLSGNTATVKDIYSGRVYTESGWKDF